MLLISPLRTILTIGTIYAAGLHSLSAQSSGDAGAGPGRIRVALGAGVMAAPKYEGSDEYHAVPLPLASLEFGDKVFLGFGAAGVYLVRENGFTGAFAVALGPGRSSSKADALAGMDKRGLGLFSVSSVSYRRGWFGMGIAGARSLGDRGGYNLRGDFSVTLPVTRAVSLGLTTSLVFADRRNMAYDFGISREEAARRAALIAAGDRRLTVGDGRLYQPGAGVRSMAAGMTLGYQATRRWGIVATLEVSRLGSQPAASPLVRRRNGLAGGLGVTLTP